MVSPEIGIAVMLPEIVPFHPFADEVILPQLANIASKFNLIKIIDQGISNTVIIEIDSTVTLIAIVCKRILTQATGSLK